MPTTLRTNIRTGYNPYGKIPGQVTTPPNYYQQTASLYPGLAEATNRYLNTSNQQMAGQIPVSDIDFLQQMNAEKSVAGGQPGGAAMPGTLYGNKTARDLGLLEYNIQNQGQQNYLQGLNTIGRLQTSPELQSSLDILNTERAAMPDPTQAANEQINLYNQGLRVGGGAGSTITSRGSPAGGTGSYTFNAPTTTGSTGGTQNRIGLSGQPQPASPYSNWQTVYNTPSNQGQTLPYAPAQVGPYTPSPWDAAVNQTMYGLTGQPQGFYMNNNQVINPTQDWYDLGGYADYFTPDFSWSEFE